MVFVNTNDLKHILDQIRIAEQHAQGTPLTDLVANPLLPYGLRLVDGTLNNLTEGRETWGSADQVMPRLLDSTFLSQPDTAHLADPNPRAPQDGPTSYTQTSGSVYDAEPRVISNLIADQTLANPAVIAAALSHVGMTGQSMLTTANEIVQAYQRVLDTQAAAGNVDQALELQRQDLQAALNKADSELAAAQQDVAAKTTAKNQADQAVTAAKQVLDDEAATMVTLQGQGQVAEMQAALDDAIAAHTQAEADLKTAQDELAQAETTASSMLTMRDAKQTTVNNLMDQKATADQELATAEGRLSDAEAALALETDSAGAVTEAQAAVDTATNAVNAAQTKVDDLDSQLRQAQTDLDDLNAQLQTAEQTRDAAQGRVTAAEQTAAETQAARETAQSRYDTEVIELATAQSNFLSALNAYFDGGPLADFSAASAAYSAAREEKRGAETALNDAIDADDTADQKVIDETSAFNQAQARVGSLTTQRDAAMTTRNGLDTQLGEANADLTTARNTLTTAEQTLQSAKDNNQAYVDAAAAVDSAQADVDAKQGVVDGLVTRLNNANQELATLNTNLDTANADVTRLEGVVQTETTDLETAAGNVTSARQDLSAAQMADEAILAQLDVIADATMKFEEATKAAAEAASALTTAEGLEATKQTAFDTATDDLAALNAPGAAEAALAAAQAAAADAQTELDTLLDTNGIVMDGNNVLLPDVTPDEGLSAPYNSWMTLFGQFFDHGLDLVSKGGSGTVYIPLQPDDPLYVEGSPTNFMVLTRATNQPGPDGVLGTADDIREHDNKTTPWVDQNQTYTSHPSHQVFLREYDLDTNGNPVSNGSLLHGQTGGMSTWGDVKAQAAAKLGIQLNDSDVLNGPLLATDPYGNFIPGPNGLPQLVVPNPDFVEGGTQPPQILVEGDLANPVDASQAVRNGHAFLEDIAHTAVPKGMIDHDRNPMTPEIEVTPDADADVGNAIAPNMFGMNETYDNELLDRHFIAGDGRGNENFGLTAVHHVFHSEHNRQVTEMKQTILESGDLAFINEWLATPIDEVDLATATVDSVAWDGGRLFQAAKFTTEMQYQHLAFEEFGRTVQPQIAAFGANASAEIDGSIMAEFAHVVYRFGHSMLTENVHTMDPNGVNTSNGLIEAFLNPVAFDQDQTLTSDQAAGAVARGMSRETGANIDEFLTSALRDNLVGLPLDLAALNIARGRETGVPSLNAAREQFYSATGSEFLKPYDSWSEYAANLKNPASIINFIAAYGTHDTIVNATTVVEKRAAATDLVLGGDTAPADRLDFVEGTGAWAAVETGINAVEFWIGGLAEAIMPFGGMLGSSFGFVFQQQMEALQNGDRFYYLARTAGMNMLAELENNSFAAMIARNTDIADGGAHIPGNIFSSMDLILEVDQAVQSMPDPVSTDVDPFLAGMGTTLVERATATADSPIIDGVREYDNFLKFNGGEHAVLGGTDQRDILNGGLGDDALWGGAGDDLLIGDAGVNTMRAGAGNDIIKDGDDVSFLHGEDGDDVISGGGGIGELMFGGKGNDAILMGVDDAAEAFGMDGNDFIYGGAGAEFMFGGEGDDWIEAGDGFDMVMGDNGDPFGGSRVVGHDVLDGGANDNDLLGEGGDDILIQREGIHVNEGDLGFDWVIHKDAMTGADIDLTRRLETAEQLDAIRDRYNLVEAASGTQFDDFLYGDDRQGEALPAGLDPLANDATLFANELTQAGVDRIEGLRELLADMMGVDPADTFTGGNILLGGGGSDVIQGRGGDDVIDGDKALNVRISIRDPQDPTVELRSINSLFEISNELLDGSISPSQLQIAREIVDAGQEGDADTAVYFDVRANYNIRANADGSVTVEHIAPPAAGTFVDPINGDPNVEGGDGTDRLTNIEILRFADMEVDLRTNPAANGLVQGTDGDDVLSGSNGPDGIFAGDGNDAINGLAGNDVIFAEGGSDTITWDAPNGGYDVVVGHGIVNDGGSDMLVINGDGTEEAFTMYTVAAWTGAGNAAPQDPLSEIVITRTVAGVENAIMEVRGIEEVTVNGVQGVETINAVGDFAATSLAPNTIYVNGTAGAEVIDFSGFTSTQRIVVDAGDGRDIITGGAGNDILQAGAGRDELTWSVGGGSDVVDGGAGEDTYTINGDALNETFRVYAAASWTGAPLASGTDIVITRDVGAGEQVIGQLQNVEEIQINTAGGADNVQVIGDFNPTALNFNTITIDDNDGGDNVNIENLTSVHRILFRTEGNGNTIVGPVRDTDVVMLPQDFDLAALTRSTDAETGMITLSDGNNSVSFTPAEQGVEPGIVVAGTPQAAAFAEQTIDPVTGEPLVPQGVLVLDKLDVDALEYMVGATDQAPVLPLEEGEIREPGEATVMRGVRDLPGLDNNEVTPGLGAATKPFIRITDARYGEGDVTNDAGEVVNREINPIFEGLDPRDISNALGAQDADTAKAASANMFLMSFGQYFDHGLTFIPKGDSGAPIAIDGADTPMRDNFADLTRAKVVGYDENGVPQHENITSPFVDQNQAYGSSAQVGRLLREPDPAEVGGLGAKLLGGAPDPSNPDFDLLPTLREALNAHIDAGTLFEDPQGNMVTLQDYYPGLRAEDGSFDASLVTDLVGNFMDEGWPLLIDMNPFIDPLDHAIAGDGRVNENIGLTSMHTVFARNHNYFVDELKISGFEGTDEELFQAAKILNEAEYQQVVFNDFADALIGGLKGSGRHGHDDYFPDTDASISHEFAGAVYRLGHSMIGETLTVMGPDGQPKDVQLFDAFLNPSNKADGFKFDHDRDPSSPDLTGQAAVEALGMGPMGYKPQPGYAEHGAGAVLEGMAQQPSEEIDFKIVDTVRDNLVRINADLFSFNVARGWDLGIGTLNQVKMDLRDSTDRYISEAIELSDMVMEPYSSWDDFQGRNNLSDTVIDQFKEAYPDLLLNPEEIESFRNVNRKIDLTPADPADWPDAPEGSMVVKGIDRVDLWVGGLAESHINGGVMGHTFWVVMHEQLDRLQEGDRFYYTDRMAEMPAYANFISNSTMADVVARNTGLEGLGENIFSYQPENPDVVEGVNLGDPVVDAATPTAEQVLADTGNAGGAEADQNGPIVADDVNVAGAEAGDDPVNETEQEVSEPITEDVEQEPLESEPNPITQSGESDDNGGNNEAAEDTSDMSTEDDPAVQMEEETVEDTAAPETPNMGNVSGQEDTETGSESPVSETSAEPSPNGSVEGPVQSGGSNGESADDALIGGSENDALNGQSGNDMLVGNAGADHLFGGDGRDDMLGGDDADMIMGGAGSDNIFGGSGDDMVIGGTGSDILIGEAGDDIFIGMDGDCNDIIYGGDGSDTIDMAAVTSDLTVRLGSTGTDRGSVHTAEGGRDTIWSIENFVGGAGDDTIFASDEANLLEGGEGNDKFVFETAASAQGDHINGFSAGDVLQFGEGDHAVMITSRDQAVDGFTASYDEGSDVSTISGEVDGDGFEMTVSGRFDLDQIA